MSLAVDALAFLASCGIDSGLVELVKAYGFHFLGAKTLATVAIGGAVFTITGTVVAALAAGVVIFIAYKGIKYYFGRKNANAPIADADAYAALQNAYEAVQRENAAIKQENDVIKQENAVIKQENDVIKHENATIKEQHNTLLNDYANLRNDNDALKKANAMLRELVGDLERQLMELKREVQELKGNVQRMVNEALEKALSDHYNQHFRMGSIAATFPTKDTTTSIINIDEKHTTQFTQDA